MRVLVVEDEKKVARFIKKAWALRDMGAEVVVGNLLDLDAMHRVIAGGDTMYFGMSVPDAYLAAMVNAAAVAKHHGVQAFINVRGGAVQATGGGLMAWLGCGRRELGALVGHGGQHELRDRRRRDHERSGAWSVRA